MFMLIRILLALLLVPVALPCQATPDSRTLLVVGDSLSAAYGIPVQNGWVALLQQRLAAEEYPYTVVNASISGDTTANARARLPQALARHQPQIVVLELGGNDGLRGLSLAAMEDNLAAMIETATASGAQVLLIGVQLPPNYGPQYTGKFQAIYRDLAQRYDIALLPSLVDGVGTDSKLMQGDGIHPNRDAQPLMLARVWDRLQPLLEYRARTRP
jgi:acyl-CoA thioesterase-1